MGWFNQQLEIFKGKHDCSDVWESLVAGITSSCLVSSAPDIAAISTVFGGKAAKKCKKQHVGVSKNRGTPKS